MTITDLLNELNKTRLANCSGIEGDLHTCLYIGAVGDSGSIPVIDITGGRDGFNVTQLTIPRPASFPSPKSYRMDDKFVDPEDIVGYLTDRMDEILGTIECIKSTGDIDADAAALQECGFKANHYPNRRDLYQFAGHMTLGDAGVSIRIIFPDSTYETPLQWVSVISDTRTYDIVDRYECNTLTDLLIHIGG